MTSLRPFCDAVLVLDTETSGLSPEREEIIEFSAVRCVWDGDALRPVAEVDELVRRKDDRRLDPRIVGLTGITDEMLREDGISKQALCTLLSELLPPRTLIAAYNAQFDLLFLYHLLAACGDIRLLQQPKLDLLTVYRDRRPFPHKLCNAIEAYGLQDRVKNSHRAIDDVRATVEVLRAMAAERDDLDRYINLFGYSRKYGVSGQRIASVRYLPQSHYAAEPLYESAPTST